MAASSRSEDGGMDRASSHSDTPSLEDNGDGAANGGETDLPKSSSHCWRKWTNRPPPEPQVGLSLRRSLTKERVGEVVDEPFEHRPHPRAGLVPRANAHGPVRAPHASQACTILLFLDGPLTCRCRARQFDCMRERHRAQVGRLPGHDVIGHPCRAKSHSSGALGGRVLAQVVGDNGCEAGVTRAGITGQRQSTALDSASTSAPSVHGLMLSFSGSFLRAHLRAPSPHHGHRLMP